MPTFLNPATTNGGRPPGVRDSSATRGTELFIKKAFEESDSTCGHRRIHAQLHRWGHAAGLELVRRLMRELGLDPCQSKPKRFGLTQGIPEPVPDFVGRNFTAEAAGEKLVGDITYIATGEGWLYLATVIDCCTKEVIGYAMDDHYQTPLISRAIRNAARNRKLARGAIFRSDRGSNYMSAEFARVLAELRLRRSAGRTEYVSTTPWRNHSPGSLLDPRGCPARHHSIHRVLVQSQTPSFGSGLPPSLRNPHRTPEVANRRVN
ncbi:DDE-type integrase/transposase/recombinase [Streptomyces sp. NPDC002659]|uniref:DDE-type integrase/transposase/recombinase n=1 Tax=Streptomyces sp. NPDC002659 TaxID=3364656 RepID=UPI003678AF95